MRKHRKLTGIIVAATLLTVLSNTAAFARQLSAAQLTQVKALGYPDFFMLVFESKGADPKTHGWKVLNPPIVMESWMYVQKDSNKFVYQNGKLASKKPLNKEEMSKLLPGTKLKPSDFDASMVPEQIKAKFGKPESVEEYSLGKNHRFEVLRYLTPATGVKSFTFFDGKLQGVLAGYAIVPKKQQPI